LDHRRNILSARQNARPNFPRKLGREWVISHDLNQLEGGSVYGNVVRYYE
jgi:hypothetical protein